MAAKRSWPGKASRLCRARSARRWFASSNPCEREPPWHVSFSSEALAPHLSGGTGCLRSRLVCVWPRAGARPSPRIVVLVDQRFLARALRRVPGFAGSTEVSERSAGSFAGGRRFDRGASRLARRTQALEGNRGVQVRSGHGRAASV